MKLLRTIIFSFFLWTVGFGASGQSSLAYEIDSLYILGDSLEDIDPEKSLQALKLAESMLSTELNDSLFVNTYFQLGGYYHHFQNYRKSEEYFSKVVEFENKVNERGILLRVAKAHNELGILHYNLHDPKEAFKNHFNSINIYKKYNDFQGLAWNYNNLGVLYEESGKIDSAIYSYEKSLENALEIDDSVGIGYNALNIGILQYDQDKYNEALNSFFTARKHFKSPKNDRILATTVSLIASVYIKYKEYDEALDQFNTSVDLQIASGNKRGLANTYEKICALYIEQNELDSAKKYANLSLDLNESIAHERGKADILWRLSIISEMEKNYDKSLKEAMRSYEIMSSTSNQGGKASAALQIAKLYIKQKKFSIAVTYADEALEIAYKQDNQTKKANAYKLLSKAHSALGESKIALQHLQKYISIKDSVFNQDRNLEFARLEAKYNTEKERELLLQQQEKAELLLQQERTSKRWTLIIGILVVLTCLVSIGAILILFRANKRHNLELEDYNHQLESKNRQLEELREIEKKYLNEKIELKDRELAAMAMNAYEKNSVLTEIESLISYNSKNTESNGDISQIQKLITTQKRLDNSWETFSQHFEKVHPQFFENLKSNHSKLTVNDLKLCAYIKVGMNNKDIAQLTSIELSSIKKSLNRLKKKIDLKPEDSLRDFILAK